MSDGGKGSARRPLSVDMKTFQENWDAIFNTDNSVPDHGTQDGVRTGGEEREDRCPQYEPCKRGT